MDIAVLTRLQYFPKCTRGILTLGDKTWFTLELPDISNAPFVSCIPKGVYYCELTQSHRFGLVYGVADVPGRTNILFHVGNYSKDTKGCILLGKSFGTSLDGDKAVFTSRKAMEDFHGHLNSRGFALHIK